MNQHGLVIHADIGKGVTHFIYDENDAPRTLRSFFAVGAPLSRFNLHNDDWSENRYAVMVVDMLQDGTPNVCAEALYRLHGAFSSDDTATIHGDAVLYRIEPEFREHAERVIFEIRRALLWRVIVSRMTA